MRVLIVGLMGSEARTRSLPVDQKGLLPAQSLGVSIFFPGFAGSRNCLQPSLFVHEGFGHDGPAAAEQAFVFPAQISATGSELLTDLQVRLGRHVFGVIVGGVVVEDRVAMVPHVPSRVVQLLDEGGEPAESGSPGFDRVVVLLLDVGKGSCNSS